MKKIVSIAFLAVISLTQLSCNIDDVQQQEPLQNLKAREQRHQIVIDQDWPSIDSTMVEYAKQNNIASRRFGPLCYTQGINFVLVRDYETEKTYKVTWKGGLSYDVEEISVPAALELCRKYSDFGHNTD